MNKSRYVVARTSEVAPGTSKLVHAGGRDIALFNLAGEFFALGNKCPHESGSLCAGKIIGLATADEPGRYRLLRDGEFVRCPWHGWEFDIRTGQSWCDPERIRVRSFDTGVSSGADLTKGPYMAETFPVSIEENYVVVEV
jgi:3-phenylpropionate/trans-cinnamate dioxygenase ferredoxin subunit